MTRDRSVGLDALRGGAALLVLLAHVDVAIGDANLRTDPGVTAFLEHLFGGGVWLFFALSGYLVGRPWLIALVRGEPLPDTGAYAWRRAGRILPAYWPALAVAVLLVGSRVEPWQVLVHALLAQSLVPGESQAVYFVAWTLGLEAVFYVLLPVAAGAIRRRRPGPIDAGRLARWLLVAFGVVMTTAPLADVWTADVGGRSPLRLVQTLPPSLAMFAPGMLVVLATLDETRLAADWWHRWRRAERHPLLLAVAATALMIVARAVWSVDEPVIALRMMPIAAVASAFALSAVLWAAPVGRVARLLAATGTVSYGVYLWHWVLVVLARDHDLLSFTGRDLSGYVVRAGLLAGASLVLGWVSWTAIERPAMAWSRQRGAQRRRVFPGSTPGPAPSPTPP